MKINDVTFFGFTKKELGAIRKQTGNTIDEELGMEFVQKVADIIGVDVMVFIQPGSSTALVKAGE